MRVLLLLNTSSKHSGSKIRGRNFARRSEELDRAIGASGRAAIQSGADNQSEDVPGEEELLQLKRIVLGLEDSLERAAGAEAAAPLEAPGGALLERIFKPAGLTCAAAADWFADGAKRARASRVESTLDLFPTVFVETGDVFFCRRGMVPYRP